MSMYFHGYQPPIYHGHYSYPVHQPGHHGYPHHPFMPPNSNQGMKQKTFFDAYKTPHGTIDYNQVSLTMGKMNYAVKQFNPIVKQFMSFLKK